VGFVREIPNSRISPMKLRSPALLALLSLIPPGYVSAQPASPGNSANAPGAANANPHSAGAGATAGSTDADRAWAAVVALRQAPVAPVVAAPSVGAPSAPALPVQIPFTPPAAAVAQSKAQVAARALAQRQTATAAKDFHARFPSHAQAPAARKLEALASLAGITDDDKVHETAALKTAGDFRANKAHPVADRYDVAHAVERHVVGRKLGGKSWLSAPFESEGLADRLRTEFGHFPGVYANYLNVAQQTQCDHGRDMARRILQMPAPAHVKAAAQRVFDRANLMRKPLDFPLKPVAGPATRLATLTGAGGGKRTVVVFWDGVRMPAGPPGLYPYVQKAPPNTSWVYISLGAWTPPSPAAKGKANANAKAGPPALKASAAPPGTYCVEPLGLRSAVAQQLKISSLPFVCVLDDQKNLNAFGRVDEIPALLAGINRLIEP
jgi:hypothetical protein